MKLDPLELGTIAAILLVLFLWGPQKIPELARTVAQARKEFDNASKEFQKVTAGITNGTSPLLGLSTPQPAHQPAPQPSRSALPQGKSGDQLLIEAARKLGIPTGGKTREQIQQEIIAMAQHPAASDASETPKTGDPEPQTG